MNTTLIRREVGELDANSTESGLLVAVCIITYNRPNGLRRLIEAIDRLEFASNPATKVSIVVVDNDPGGAALELCDELAARIRWPLKAVIEPRRGIPFARNTALAHVPQEAEFVAFIDDDEVPTESWLDSLLSVQMAYQADVVTGPVLPHFMTEPPRWMADGGFFNRMRRPTGTRLDTASTNNTIVRASVLRTLGITFNERMAYTGGTDTHFFLRIARAGYVIVFAEDAIVYEWVPPSRMTAKWILQRAFRLGNTLSLCERDLAETPTVLVARAVKGAARIVVGLVKVIASPLALGRKFRTTALKGMRQVMFGFGMLAGLIGHRYEEYRKTHDV